MKSYLKFLIDPMFIVFIGLTMSCSREIDDSVIPENKGDYTLNTKYDSIRSYPGGGGLFIIYITPAYDFSGAVSLSLLADPLLHASLSKETLTQTNYGAEIIINPDANISLTSYKIDVIATNGKYEHRIKLKVQIYDWYSIEDVESINKKNQFKSWCIMQNPKYATAFSNSELIYETYPEILIVEHLTYITSEWEVRLCYHVMIPPNDWSMLRIRKRNSLEPEFAAKRETDGSIHQLPLAEYPQMFGY
jgi:hypothetical protein